MLRFHDGWDHYATLTRKWTATATGGSCTLSISSGNGRNSTSSFRIASNIGFGSLSKTIDAQSTWIVGFAYKVSSLSGHGGGAILTLRDAGTTQVDLRVLTDGTLRVTRNGTTLGTSTEAISQGNFFYIELKVKIHSSTGTVEVRLNGSQTPILSLTGLNTQNSGNATANQIVLGSLATNETSNQDYDDLYICDDQGSANNTFLGDVRVGLKLANGAGNSAQWTPSAGANYQCVDDNPPNDDTDYVSSANPGEIDLYAFAALSGSPGSVLGVQVSMLARKDDAGTRTIRPKIRRSSTNYNGTNVDLSTSYVYYTEMFEQDPSTLAAWTPTNLDAAEFGVEEIA